MSEKIDATRRDQLAVQLYEGVTKPVFFAKLAQHGIHPRSEAEAAELLEIGNKLRLAKQADQTKEAADSSSTLRQISNYLDGVLGRSAQADASAAWERQAAEFVAADQTIMKAAADLVSLLGQSG